MNDFNAHILADEASTGGVVVGTGISAALLLFFQQSFERMLPYLIIAAVVILIDLVFGIRAAKRKGDRITLVLPERIGKCRLEKIDVAMLEDAFRRGLAMAEALA